MNRDNKSLILNNMGLVTTIADKYYKKFIGQGIDFEDIRQEGYIGLIKASERFKDNKGIKFSTYACRLIEGEIMHFILQDRHNFRMKTIEGTRKPTPIKHYNFEKSLNPFSVSFKTDSLLLDLGRILSKRELFVLKKYFYESYKLREIGEFMNCTGQNIDHIKRSAFMKIKENLQFDL